MVAMMGFMPVTHQVQGATVVTRTYSDVSLTSSGTPQGNVLSDIWNAFVGDLTIKGKIDLRGIKDEDPGTGGWDWGDHAWGQWGVHDTSTTSNFNPNNKGVWIASDYADSNGIWPPIKINTFDPDPPGAPILDMDDKLILQKVSGQGEGAYDRPTGLFASAPPAGANSQLNYAIWSDRDGVSDSQKTLWGAKDGITYNTGGILDVEIVLHATSATTGTAYLYVNGEAQGFFKVWKDAAPDFTPAGMTWTGDMKHLQVFQGLYGYGATHNIKFTNIQVTGVITYDTVTAKVLKSNGTGIANQTVYFSEDNGVTWQMGTTNASGECSKDFLPNTALQVKTTYNGKEWIKTQNTMTDYTFVFQTFTPKEKLKAPTGDMPIGSWKVLAKGPNTVQPILMGTANPGGFVAMELFPGTYDIIVGWQPSFTTPYKEHTHSLTVASNSDDVVYYTKYLSANVVVKQNGANITSSFTKIECKYDDASSVYADIKRTTLLMLPLAVVFRLTKNDGTIVEKKYTPAYDQSVAQHIINL